MAVSPREVFAKQKQEAIATIDRNLLSGCSSFVISVPEKVAMTLKREYETAGWSVLLTKQQINTWNIPTWQFTFSDNS